MSYKLLCCVILLCGLIAIRQHLLDQRVARFNEYLRKFNKSYEGEEFYKRLLHFEESLEEIRKLNNEHKTGAVHGHTKFSDWSMEERNSLFLEASRDCSNIVQSCTDANITSRVYEDLPDSFDWRDRGGVIGSVEQQKMCNGCWAFSIAGTMSSMAAINNLGNEVLSVQEVLDCSPTNKCRGGNIAVALKFICRQKFKLTSEDKYPLILYDEKCKTYHNLDLIGIKNYTISCDVSDDVIMRNVLHGPVIAVIVAHNLFSYTGGIIQWNCWSLTSMVHVVQIIGYGTEYTDGGYIDYYIIKNSYGPDWGENGFFRIARHQNVCGINNQIAFLDVLK